MRPSSVPLAVVLLAAHLACGDDGGESTPIDAGTGPDAAPPTPTVFAADQDLPCCLAVDADSVYWINMGREPLTGELWKVAKSGGTPVSLADGFDFPAGLVDDATHLYWTDSSAGTISRIPKAGGTAEEIAVDQYPWNIAIDETNVYWSNGDIIMSLPKAGGVDPTELTTGQSQALYVAVGDTHVYWTDETDGTVMRVAKAGGMPMELASGQGTPQAIAVGASEVFWLNRDGTLMSVSKAGGTPSNLASGQTAPAGIAVIDGAVYWTTAGDLGTSNGTVMRLASGGTPEVLADSQNAPWNIDHGEDAFFWANQGSLQAAGAIMRLAR